MKTISNHFFWVTAHKTRMVVGWVGSGKHCAYPCLEYPAQEERCLASSVDLPAGLSPLLR